VAREHLNTSIGVGITGVAGPDPQEDKPVGTMHIAVDDGGEGGHIISYQFAQGREAAKRRAVTVAFQLLRRVLMASGG
ncbi:MAG: CinA family protein, partial [Chloroflexi bacterium]|nr:CinA family protein [Chloroflexota bacterium]